MKLLEESDAEMCNDDVLDPTYRTDDSEEKALEKIKLEVKKLQPRPAEEKLKRK